MDKRYWILVAWTTIYLIPYWLISDVDRYGTPLVAIKALMVIMVIASIRRGTTQDYLELGKAWRRTSFGSQT